MSEEEIQELKKIKDKAIKLGVNEIDVKNCKNIDCVEKLIKDFEAWKEYENWKISEDFKSLMNEVDEFNKSNSHLQKQKL